MSEKIAECLKRGIDAEEKKSTLDLLRRDFNWDAIADRTLAVYRSVLEPDRRAGPRIRRPAPGGPVHRS